MVAIAPISDVLRRARAATLLASVTQRGALALDAPTVAAFGQRGWTAPQIAQAAHDLADAGDVLLAPNSSGTLTITTKGGAG